MFILKRRAVRLLVVGIGLVTGLSPVAAASERGFAAAEQVSEVSYRDFLDNWLFAHAGDNRGIGGAEHDLARDNITSLLTSYGLIVTLEPFDYQGTTYFNVVGTKLGTERPDQEYIVGAHYDSVGNPGADDNASGVALVLEAARVLSQYDSVYTIRFIAFDREEQGLVGSAAYVDAHTGDDILGMISTDMVAYNTGANAVDVFGQVGSAGLVDSVIAAVDEYGDGLTGSANGPSGGSDHVPFENAGYPACLFIEDWGNPHYHTQSDHVDVPGYIDYAYATRMTRSIVGLLVDLAEVAVPVDALEFTLPDPLPEHIDPSGGSTVRVEVSGLGTEVPAPGTGTLYYDTGLGWQTVAMTEVGPNTYDAVFPPGVCLDTVAYYFSAMSMTAVTYTRPREAPVDHYDTLYTFGTATVLEHDFEADSGWTAENLGALTGDWDRGAPVDDPNWAYDPISDSDGSGQCYLTQNVPGNTDVDDGAVRLTSPVFDMSGGDVLLYDYFLFLTSDDGQDMLLVEVDNQAGDGGWTEVTRHVSNGGLTWSTHQVTRADLLAISEPATANMRFRFTANDSDPQSIVEAGLDAFRLLRYNCAGPCPADLTSDGSVDVQDLIAMLTAWGSNPGHPADLNDDGAVTVPDLLELLAAWGPC